jgi:hypothetical protein
MLSCSVTDLRRKNTCIQYWGGTQWHYFHTKVHANEWIGWEFEWGTNTRTAHLLHKSTFFFRQNNIGRSIYFCYPKWKLFLCVQWISMAYVDLYTCAVQYVVHHCSSTLWSFGRYVMFKNHCRLLDGKPLYWKNEIYCVTNTEYMETEKWYNTKNILKYIKL